MTTDDISIDTKTFWTTETNAAHFFHQKIVEAQSRQQLKLSESVEFYLVNLLCDFLQPVQESTNDCLALLLKQALESSPTEQVLLFKRLGDTALYFSGFFQEYFTRKSFDVGYYVSMGESAYGQLSQLMRRRYVQTRSALCEMYQQMSENFSSAVDILMDVSEQTSHTSLDRSALSLYDAWLSTASQKLEKQLIAQGIFPIAVSKNKKH